MLAAFPRGPPEWGGTQRQPQGLGCPFGGGEHSRTGLTSLDPTLKRTKRHCSVCHSVVKVTHSHYMCLTAMRRAGPRHQTLARKTHRDKPTERSPPQLPPPPRPPSSSPHLPLGLRPRLGLQGRGGPGVESLPPPWGGGRGPGPAGGGRAPGSTLDRPGCPAARHSWRPSCRSNPGPAAAGPPN